MFITWITHVNQTYRSNEPRKKFVFLVEVGHFATKETKQNKKQLKTDKQKSVVDQGQENNMNRKTAPRLNKLVHG